MAAGSGFGWAAGLGFAVATGLPPFFAGAASADFGLPPCRGLAADGLPDRPFAVGFGAGFAASVRRGCGW